VVTAFLGPVFPPVAHSHPCIRPWVLGFRTITTRMRSGASTGISVHFPHQPQNFSSSNLASANKLLSNQYFKQRFVSNSHSIISTGLPKNPVRSRSYCQSPLHDFDCISPLRGSRHHNTSLTCTPAEVGFLPFFRPTTYQGDLASLLRVTTQARITEIQVVTTNIKRSHG